MCFSENHLSPRNLISLLSKSRVQQKLCNFQVTYYNFVKLPYLELNHWSKSNSFLSRLSHHQLLLFTRDFLLVTVLGAFNLSWYFSSLSWFVSVLLQFSLLSILVSKYNLHLLSGYLVLFGKKAGGQSFQYLINVMIIECFKMEMLNQLLCLAKKIDS